VAREVARKVAERLASDQPKSKQYQYGDRPLPEPILQEFEGGENPKAVVTRNAYGVTILNTRDLMFIDIDRESKAPAPSAPAGDLLSSVLSLFGKHSEPPPAPPQPAPVDSVVVAMQMVAERNRLAVRVYKTAGGYRGLVVNTGFDPGSPESETLLREFDSDPLYIRLCRMQESFRARLTPKPWRCGASTPPAEFPFESREQAARFHQWEAEYKRLAGGYATCKYLSSFGGSMDPAFEELVHFHDQETRANSSLPLA